MPRDLFFNLAADDPNSALALSLENNDPAPTPVFVVGDELDVRVYLSDGLGGYDALSGGMGVTMKLGVSSRAGASPTGGTFTLTYGANTTSALAYNATAQQVEDALNALASVIADGSLDVSGTFPNCTIDWRTTGNKNDITGSATLLTPDSAVVISTVREGTGSVTERVQVRLVQKPAAFQDTWSSITSGWQGALNFNVQGIVDLLDGDAEAEGVLECEVTDNAGNTRTVGQVDCIIRNEVIDEASLVPTPTTSYLTQVQTQAQFVQNRSAITGLTGGGGTKLDGLATAGGAAAAGWVVEVQLNAFALHYQLVTGTDAEDSPYIIRPDDYDGATNTVVWKLRAPNINDLTEDGTPDGAADFVQTWDASEDRARKVLLNNLPGGGGGGGNPGRFIDAGDLNEGTYSGLDNWLDWHQTTFHSALVQPTTDPATLDIDIGNTNANEGDLIHARMDCTAVFAEVTTVNWRDTNTGSTLATFDSDDAQGSFFVATFSYDEINATWTLVSAHFEE